jgi:hypothetical protein
VLRKAAGWTGDLAALEHRDGLSTRDVAEEIDSISRAEPSGSALTKPANQFLEFNREKHQRGQSQGNTQIG